MKLLESAGAAVKALTTSNDESEKGTIESRSIEDQKEAFTTASSQYLTLLSSIDVRLRRQINALEDAEIISAEATSRDSQSIQAPPPTFPAMGGPATQSKQTAGNRAVITGGGLGSLDVGWLNSRNDHIGKGMEAELWEEAQNFVEKLRRKKELSENNEGVVNGYATQGSHQDLGQNGDSLMDQT